ncbi:lipase/acyltransferase domain-containing protein [Pyxidicoccus sp. 3LFB2]
MFLRRCFAWALLATALTGCSVARVQLAPPTGDEVTLLVPGYRGSFLVTEGPEPERAWFSPGDVVTRGDRSLALPFPGQRPAERFGPLLPDGPITKLTLIPLLASIDVYRSTLEFGRERFPGFTAFGYDWRRDIRESAGALCARIGQLVAEGGGRRKVNLVVHSMGGLVALHCLLHGGAEPGTQPWAGAAHVQRVVFVGTPFRGSPGIFDDLHEGTTTGRNTALLRPEALFTFASSFQLLPWSNDFLRDAGGAPVALDPYAPEQWWTRGWGVFAEASLREDAAYREQLTRMLDARRALAEALAPREGLPPPPFQTLVVVGTGRSTTSGFRMKDGALDLDDEVKADGDGAVLTTSAVPALPLPFERVDSRAEHVALMSDDDVLEAIARFLGRPAP